VKTNTWRGLTNSERWSCNVGSTFGTSSTPQLYSARLPKGTYDINVNGILSDTVSGGSDSYVCRPDDHRR